MNTYINGGLLTLVNRQSLLSHTARGYPDVITKVKSQRPGLITCTLFSTENVTVTKKVAGSFWLEQTPMNEL